MLPTEGDRSELLDCLAPTLTDVGKKHGKKIVTLKELLEKRPKEEELRRKKILKDYPPPKLLKQYVAPTEKIPWLVEVCVKYISKFGIVSGIYRKPGSIVNVELLRHLFEREQIRVTADDLESYNEIKNDQYCVASFLKSFFRELKEPLITTSVFKKCEDARLNCKQTDERKDLYIQALQGLSHEHWNTLKFLATHLYELSQEDHITNMNVENLARIWTSNLIRRDDLNSIMMPNANLETIVMMKSNVCADSDVLTDIIRMVPEIFGYKVPTPNVDQFIQSKAKFVLHNVGPRDDSCLPRCKTLSELGDSGVEYDPSPKLRRRTSITSGKSQSTSHLPSATSNQSISPRFGEKVINPDNQHSRGDMSKIFEEKENINTSGSRSVKTSGSTEDPATYHPLAQTGDGITRIGANPASVLKNSSTRNSLNNDDDVIDEGAKGEEVTPVAAPRQSSIKSENRQSVFKVENF